jgi:putative hemolysin
VQCQKTVAIRATVIQLSSTLHRSVALEPYRLGIANDYEEMRVLLEIGHEIERVRQRGLSVELATSTKDIEAAQRLRYRVFAGEMGARITTRTPGHDQDMFDPRCEHLIVRDDDTDRIVGTQRILTAERAKSIGAFYSDGHFDLTRLARLRSASVEIGRACIHPEYRKGTAIMLLWEGVARLMHERGLAYLIGCVSITMMDRGANARRVYQYIAPRYLAPIEYRVRPRHELRPHHEDESTTRGAAPVLPSLLKGYLQVGAWVGGEPAWDPNLNTADLFILLPLARAEVRGAAPASRSVSATL